MDVDEDKIDEGLRESERLFHKLFSKDASV